MKNTPCRPDNSSWAETGKKEVARSEKIENCQRILAVIPF